VKPHRNCITDPLARTYWREYQQVCADGNPLGLSYVEYVAHRVASLGSRIVYETSADQTPWYVSTCGHQHPWGVTCASWTDV
jgi:hypothetical protein